MFKFTKTDRKRGADSGIMNITGRYQEQSKVLICNTISNILILTQEDIRNTLPTYL
jgi:hypothetical protein